MPQGLAGVIVKAVIMAVLSAVISKLLAKKPKTPTTEVEGLQLNTRSTQEPLRVVYGTQRVGGNDVYMTTKGSKNKTLWIIQSISEGECEGLLQEAGVDQVFVDDKLYTEFTDYATLIDYVVYTGTSSQNYDATLNTAEPSWVDNLRYTAYIRWKFTWDGDQFRGVPKRTLTWKGKKLYDFRDTTTAYSANPALALYDFFTNNRYGLGVDSSKIDLTSWTTAANYCDAQGWELHYVVNRGEKSAWDIVTTILQHFRGTVSWFDGKYYLNYADLYEESSVLTIEDNQIAQDASGAAQVSLSQPSRYDTPTSIRVKFIDKDKKYVEDDVVIGEDTGITNEFILPGCTDRELASNLATSALERSQLNRSLSVVLRDDCIQLAPHDIITFNCNALAISDQLMRVVQVSLSEVGSINAVLQYESYDIYDDDYNLDIEGVYTVDLPDPTYVPGIVNPTMTEETAVDKLRTFQRLSVEFTVDEDDIWFKHVEVWQHITISGTPPESSEYTHQFDSTTDFKILGPEQGQTYYIKLRPVNIWGAKADFDNADVLSTIIQGNSDAPESLAGLVAVPSNDGINLYSDKLDDPDIEIYEFRLGSQWTGGIFLASIRSPNYSLKSVKPGIHSFAANTKGTNGIYGETPRIATATIESPKGWSSYTTFTNDYTSASGTFDNTEHITYNGDDYLKCTHSGSILTGTYTSYVHDVGIGNNDIYYIYLDADIVVTGAGTDWDSVTSSGVATWDEINASTRTWNELVELIEAPQVSIYIDWKLNIGDDWSTIERAEILAGVANSRYYRVRISITDPSISVNALVENYSLTLLN